ncbi:hypothetical protein OG21DRAFT_1507522 [Imleria badia]|nr:hypothetical protein OG21DRAFT_1507522 [Imleria badia]
MGLRTNHDTYVNPGGLSRAAIFNAVDALLTRLATSYLVLPQIHRYIDPTCPPKKHEALHDLFQSGKVCYMGASLMQYW